jgi:ADP-heptose:LPS heptosyltransferase/glycosyltransferase involved in cell wall biosynthesis
VLAQDYADFEHIIVDGASKDETIEILEQYPHIRWISEPDEGEGDALNKALRMVTGDMVCWLNSDDWLEKGVFHRVAVEYRDFRGHCVIYGNTNMVDESTKLLWMKRSAPGMSLQLLLRWWLFAGHPHQPSMFFPTEVIRKTGFFNQDLHFSIDYEYWLRCARAYPFHHVDQTMSNARLRDNSKSINTEVGQIQSHWNVLRPHLETLPEPEQISFWRDYYVHRIVSPLPEESTTRLPDNNSSAKALSQLLQEMQKAGKTEGALICLYPSDEPRRRALHLLQNFLKHGNINTGIQPGHSQTPQRPSFERNTIKNIRVAGNNEQDEDTTRVGTQSVFADAVKALFTRIRPGKIIETGTFLGAGTTTIMASALEQLGIKDAAFYTIEVSPIYHQEALRCLDANGLAKYVTPLNGLSIPRSLLPSLDEIEDTCVENIQFDDIFVDHEEKERTRLYHRETNFEGVPDDLLGQCLRKFDYKPDFVLLDSGGHMGNIEFNYLIDQIRGPCHIALDDIHHVKHRKSFEQIQNDPRFEVIVSAREKFGFCIAKFTPRPEKIQTKVERILWVRPDAIGDNILAASMLPHIGEKYKTAKITAVCQDHVSELYQASPHVDDVQSFDRRRLIEDEPYRNDFLLRLRAMGADVSLNSVYSREHLTDLLALEGGAGERIALYGDLCNISEDARNRHNGFYNRLIPSNGGWKLEIERHRDFLMGLGIAAPELEPVIWLTAEDERFADEFFRKDNLESNKTIGLFAGAQSPGRVYAHYGKAISKICMDRQLTVIAFGSGSERHLNESNLKDIGVRTINLSGRTTLRQTAAILKRCRLAVGAETGTAHMACAVGTPNVVLLGGGHFGRFMPYSPLTSIACLPLECYQCNWRCKFGSPHCVWDISPHVITEAVRSALEELSHKPRVFYQGQSMWSSSPELPAWKDPAMFMDGETGVFIPVEASGAMGRARQNGPDAIPAASAPNHGLAILRTSQVPPILAPQVSGTCDLSVSGRHDDCHQLDASPVPQLWMGEKYAVSAIVSTYNSERFMRGLLEDLEAQTIRDRMEIIIIDSGSQQSERAIVQELQKRYDNIRYFRTERESLYASWNRAIRLARGKFITNANTDDRHRGDALEILMAALEQNDNIDLVYGDCYITEVANQTYDENPKQEHLGYPDFFAPDVLFRYQFGPQPMWRKTMHDVVGYFDDAYRAAGDYDFNIRFAFSLKALHITDAFGLYLRHEDAITFKDSTSGRETVKICGKYRTSENIEKLYRMEGVPGNSPEDRAHMHLDLGVRILTQIQPWTNGATALQMGFANQCFHTAAASCPHWPAPYNNMAISLYYMGHEEEAINILAHTSDTIRDPRLLFNLAALREAADRNRMPGELKLISSDLRWPASCMGLD